MVRSYYCWPPWWPDAAIVGLFWWPGTVTVGLVGSQKLLLQTSLVARSSYSRPRWWPETVTIDLLGGQKLLP
jgi:hypothetical protein